MKRYKIAIWTLSVLLLVGLTTVLIGSKEAENVVEQHTALFQATLSADVPDYVDFCGERISLNRLDMRERFDREINALAYLHSSTMLYIKRANRFFPVIEPILKKNGIPVDFKYLCVIESGLDTRALSPAKAAGLWQFMDSTGKSFGLEITAEVDERYHTEKATEAACRYLKSAYSRYGNWADVAASYNAGLGRISGEMKNQLADSSFDLLLVSETSRYIFRILAMKTIFENPKEYGFLLKKENLYPLVSVNQVEITSDIDDLASFAKENGISYMQLKDYNVWLRGTQLKVAKGKSYQVAVPKEEDLYYDARKIKVYDKAWVN